MKLNLQHSSLYFLSYKFIQLPVIQLSDVNSFNLLESQCKHEEYMGDIYPVHVYSTDRLILVHLLCGKEHLDFIYCKINFSYE